MKPNGNICTEELLTILKNICDKCITIIENISCLYGVCHHKTTFHQFSLRDDEPVNNERVRQFNGF